MNHFLLRKYGDTWDGSSSQLDAVEGPRSADDVDAASCGQHTVSDAFASTSCAPSCISVQQQSDEQGQTTQGESS